MLNIVRKLAEPDLFARVGRKVGRDFLSRRPEELALNLSSLKKGSKSWLIGAEAHYGGFQDNVERRKISPHDTRTDADLSKSLMQGGDRMHRHFYAPDYSRHLAPFLKADIQVVLCEVGILRGTGLAVWCDLFPDARVIGLDFDLSHFEENKEYLLGKRAFTNNSPEVYQFDQLGQNDQVLDEILNGDRVSIMIDDAIHSETAILKTIRDFRPHLSSEFVYFVEDNNRVAPQICDACPDWSVYSHLEMTVINPRG